MSTVHVVPINDLVEHADSEDCVCGPTTEFAEPHGWVISHHSLDGRERSEHDREES